MTAITDKNQAVAARKELSRLLPEMQEALVNNDSGYDDMGIGVGSKSAQYLRTVVAGLEDWNLQQPTHKIDTGAMMDQIAQLPVPALGR